MSRSARLARLEAAAPFTPADRGSHCRDCGGLRIDEVLLAFDTIERRGTQMPSNEAESVYAALDAGEPSCRRCGGETLVGALQGVESDPAA